MQTIRPVALQKMYTILRSSKQKYLTTGEYSLNGYKLMQFGNKLNYSKHKNRKFSILQACMFAMHSISYDILHKNPHCTPKVWLRLFPGVHQIKIPYFPTFKHERLLQDSRLRFNYMDMKGTCQ